MRRRVKKAAAVLLAMVLGFGSLSSAGQLKKAEAATENLIVNGNFEDSDNLEAWNVHQNGATITAEVSDTPIGDNKVYTYGKITNRTSNYQCFAQDVTAKMERGETYYYTFYIMLDYEDYKDAPAEQRSVEISPHVRTNMGDSYSQGVGGTVTQTLEPGVWTKFTGTFSPTWNGELQMIALRFLEQGTNYGSGPGVMGTYYITGVELYQQDKEPELIQKGIVSLDKAVNKKLGADGDYIVGTAVSGEEALDIEVMGLVTKHFNALTLGNELKPQFIFASSYSSVSKTETVVFNGEEMEVPLLDFSSAERILDIIYKWNNNNPNDTIKIRGHVLVWHSQTPEWFFHEDYDESKPLVSAETMSKRLEWYIASVAEHFTGEDSKYAGMFYAWDVVNEAVSDSTGTYRSDKESSMWWAVYQSNEYIIQAFRYANKYMPADVDLYYNDYNDCSSKKVKGIAQLLQDVKDAEGTRIDGMGMQGHYQTQLNPTTAEFEETVRTYAKIVDKIQITEWDLKVSSDYIGTEYSKQTEYTRQAKRYYDFYQSIQKLRAEGINFCGMTFWGVIDTNSWLQSSSTVGGGSDGKIDQHPLLFDGEYQAKPAFWAFADETRYNKLVNPTPTPTPKPTEAPEPTEGAELTPALSPEPTQTPADTPAQGGGTVVTVVIVAVVAAVAVLGGVLVAKKKRK